MNRLNKATETNTRTSYARIKVTQNGQNPTTSDINMENK